MSGGLKDRGASPEQRSLLQGRRPARRPSPAPEGALRQRRAGGAARLRAARAGAVQRHSPPRHQADGQAADRALRLVCRGRSMRPPERLKEVKGVGDAAIMQLKLVRAGGPAPDAGRHHAAPGADLLDRRARLLPRRHGLRGARAVPHPVPRQEEPADRRRGAAAAAPSITRPSTCARSSSGRWSCPPAPSSWCTTTPPATRRPRAPTST